MTEVPISVEAPATSTPSVEVPVTPRVVPTVAAPVIAADAIVEAPAVNASTVVAPVTSSVPPTEAAPVTSADANVEAPAFSTPRVDVPATSRVPDRSMLVRAMSASRSIVTSSFSSCVVTLYHQLLSEYQSEDQLSLHQNQQQHSGWYRFQLLKQM